MKTAHTLSSLLALACVATASSVWAQRVQFPTPVQSPPAAAPAATAPSSVYTAPQPGAYSPPPATPYSAPPATGAYAPPSSAPPAAGSYPPPGPTPYAPSSSSPPALLSPPGTAPGAYPQPAAAGVAPYGAPGTYTPSPAAAPAPGAYGYPTQPPPPSWDPYAAPGNAPSALIPQDPCIQSPDWGLSMTSVQKFIQHVDLDYAWFAGSSQHDNQLGINDINLSVTCAIPMFYNTQTPLLVTPGFAAHYWAGPVSVFPVAPTDPAPADLPPRTYDAYLDFGWNPQVTNFFGAELNFRTGVYSDFTRVTTESLRFMGKGMAVVKLWPSVTVKAGVWYLDRVKIKMLPAGGIVWTPNPDVYFNILFPNPKIGKRLTTLGTTEWWIYASGNYGGGSWNIEREDGLPPNPFYPDTNGTHDNFDYNDIRIAGGLEFKTMRHLNGYAEVGLSCSRELIYESGLPPALYPNNTVFIAAGLAY